MTDGKTHNGYLQMPVFIQIDIEATVTTKSFGKNFKWRPSVKITELITLLYQVRSSILKDGM